MTKLINILNQIDTGSILLPEFQRGYVWNRDQVRALMRSLYRGYPVGGLLVWETGSDAGAVRGQAGTATHARQLLLDGQQRMTSLYGVVMGKAPNFFEGKSDAFTGLHFHVENQVFEFYAPTKMRDDPRWVDVSDLFADDGLPRWVAKLNAQAELQPHLVRYMTRLAQLQGLLNREFHIEKITGEAMTVDVVVDIFNKVNSGGTKLSKGDLALARLCAQWPEARGRLRKMLATWEVAGYDFSLDWLLRNTNAVATGKAPFAALESITADEFKSALSDTGKHIGLLLDLVAGRLGLDHDRVLLGRYAFPVMSRYLHIAGGKFADHHEQDRVLYWYLHAGLWGRFSGSTESVLGQDYETVDSSGIDGLITTLERSRGGSLTIQPYDFEGFGRGSRFYPLLYLLTRVAGARDLGNGLPLHSQMLGHLASLQVHHIFPKAQLYASGRYSRGQVNDVPNFCFLTQQSNLAIGKRLPEDYLAEVADAYPGVLESQWIPTDRQLWRIDRYADFLQARRELLADAANTFLAQLRDGARPQDARKLERLTVVPDARDERSREREVDVLIEELLGLGYVRPRRDDEVADPDDGRVLAVAEAHWPDGLQPGIGDPVVLELDADDMDRERMEGLGYLVFSTAAGLREYVARQRRLGVEDEPATTPEAEPPGQVALGT